MRIPRTLLVTFLAILVANPILGVAEAARARDVGPVQDLAPLLGEEVPAVVPEGPYPVMTDISDPLGITLEAAWLSERTTRKARSPTGAGEAAPRGLEPRPSD